MIHIPCAVAIQLLASIAEGLLAIWAMSSIDFAMFEPPAAPWLEGASEKGLPPYAAPISRLNPKW
ncbi:hypothetical protein PtB15_17B439 [Puccinia triticina]|nr:hypothetical protein PtB15_17B439 [Puccinia triticina]